MREVLGIAAPAWHRPGSCNHVSGRVSIDPRIDAIAEVSLEDAKVGEIDVAVTVELAGEVVGPASEVGLHAAEVHYVDHVVEVRVAGDRLELPELIAMEAVVGVEVEDAPVHSRACYDL